MSIKEGERPYLSFFFRLMKSYENLRKAQIQLYGSLKLPVIASSKGKASAALHPPGNMKEVAAQVPLGIIGVTSFDPAQVTTSYDECSRSLRPQLGGKGFRNTRQLELLQDVR